MGSLTVSVLFENGARLLAARSQVRAAEILLSMPFQVVETTNHFNDESSVLHAVVPLKEYERLRRYQDTEDRQAYLNIADTLAELGTYIRFVVAELALESPDHTGLQRGPGLKRSDISKLVNKPPASTSGCATAASGSSRTQSTPSATRT
jgi:hypothetical protein